MKKALTNGKMDLQMWQHSPERDSHYIGTRHLVIRMQEVPVKLRATLASIGIFSENTTSNGSNCPDVAKIMHTNSDKPFQQLIDTKFTTMMDKTSYRVFVNEVTNQFVYANDIYITEIESFFGDNAGTWAHDGNKFSPLIFGNHLGLVLPFKVPSEESVITNRIRLMQKGVLA